MSITIEQFFIRVLCGSMKVVFIEVDNSYYKKFDIDIKNVFSVES